MNTVYKGLKEKAVTGLADPKEQWEFYTNMSIEYLSERIESMMTNTQTLDEAVELTRQVEGFLDKLEGIE